MAAGDDLMKTLNIMPYGSIRTVLHHVSQCGVYLSLCCGYYYHIKMHPFGIRSQAMRFKPGKSISTRKKSDKGNNSKSTKNKWTYDSANNSTNVDLDDMAMFYDRRSATCNMTPTYFLRWHQTDGNGYKVHISFARMFQIWITNVYGTDDDGDRVPMRRWRIALPVLIFIENKL